MASDQKVTALRLTCGMSSVATKAQGTRDESLLQLEVFPEGVGAGALQDALELIRVAPVISVQRYPRGIDQEEAVMSWNGGALQLTWADRNSEPWALTGQVMKHLFMQSMQIRILELCGEARGPKPE